MEAQAAPSWLSESFKEPCVQTAAVTLVFMKYSINLFSPINTLLYVVTGCCWASPGLPVAPQQGDKGLDLPGRDVFFQQLAVVVQQGGDGVLGQDLVAHLRLHYGKLFGDVFLHGSERRTWEKEMSARKFVDLPIWFGKELFELFTSQRIHLNFPCQIQPSSVWFIIETHARH